jgi:Flp pilus assembly protein TadB
MARQSALRAADRDREAVAERLRHAAGEGRLEPHELEERLHAALRARTYGELRWLTSDLPAPAAARRRRTPPIVRASLAVGIALALVAAFMIVVAVAITGWMLWVVVWLCLCLLRTRSRSASRPRRTLRRTERWPTSAGGHLARDPWRA